jgi:hypothetical protein
MSTLRNLPPATNGTLDDCARLWTTLTTEYIPGLRVEMTLCQDASGKPYIAVDLCDYSTLTLITFEGRSLWARKLFFNPLHLISYGQLFDLLITGYRVIDEYFATGKDNRPSPLKD